jgi:ferredoxin
MDITSGDVVNLLLPYLAIGHISFAQEGFKSVGPIQYALHKVYAYIEPSLLRMVDFLIAKPIMTNTRIGRRILYLIAWASYIFPYGIVVSTEAAMRLVDHIDQTEGPKDVVRFAVGPCVCQRALNRQKDPYCKDIVLLYGADIYLHMLIGYKIITAHDVKEILKNCRDKGLVHCVDFCMHSGRWMFVICNCDSEICVLTRTYSFTGKFLYAGPERVARKADLCIGPENCGACIRSCIFGANTIYGENILVDQKRCMGCGQCAHVCKGDARSMEQRPDYAHGNIIDEKILLSIE